jgi:hypothetical protein
MTSIATVVAVTMTVAKKKQLTKSCSGKSGNDGGGRGISGGGNGFDVGSNARRRQLWQSATQYHKMELRGRGGNLSALFLG